MLATRPDGRTIADILALHDDQPERAAGQVECRDPACPEWGSGEVDAFWRHFHREN